MTWRIALTQRAHWLIPLAFLILIVLIKDLPPPSCSPSD